MRNYSNSSSLLRASAREPAWQSCFEIDLTPGRFHIPDMTVTLPATLETFVQSQLENGAFSSTEDVIAAGLQLLRQQEETWRASAREKIDEGWSQAKAGQFLTPEQARASLREIKAARH